MIKTILFIALALTLCQAMPSNFNGDSDVLSRSVKEMAERIFEQSNQIEQQEREVAGEVVPFKRYWMENSNGSVVPLFTVKREFMRDMVKSANETSRDVPDESTFVKRVWNTMIESERREFVEPSRVAEFEEKKKQFTRNFEESTTEEFSRRDMPWTSEVKRVWQETVNGTVVPMKRDEFNGLVDESIVVPVKREWLEEAAADKRDFLENVKREMLESARLSNFTEQAIRSFDAPEVGEKDLLRHSRSLSEEELRSQNVTEFVKMCDGSSQFKYYQPHPVNESLYIQCDPWGQPVVRACEEGLIWDQWRLRCCTPESVKNSTRVGYEFELLHAVESLFDCNLPQYTCVNGGICTKLSAGYKCVCSGNFTGDLCEIRVESDSIFSEILSGNFSFEQYRERLVHDRADEMKYFEQYKPALSEVTYEELVKYLSSYKQGEVRYDRLVSNVIEDILEDIYPDAFYLSVFNASSESVANVVRMIPNLLSYTKYSNERYVQVFYQYQKALERLVEIFNSSWPTVEREASEYYKLTSLYLNNSALLVNQTGVVRPIEVREGPVEQEIDGAFSFGSRPVETHKTGLAGGSGPVEWTDVQVVDKLKTEYNETVPSQEQLFDLFERFRVKALQEIKLNKNLVSMPLVDAKFEYVNETVAKFEELSKSSMQVWNSLCNYGFWYLTNLFSKEQF